MNPVTWQHVSGRIVRGHQVASGSSRDPRFPGGTLRMQQPCFKALGLDLSPYFFGTLNVSIAPERCRLIQPRLTFRSVKWHLTEPAEDFSFIDLRVTVADSTPIEGLIYYPHPETKPAHFQPPSVLELLVPFINGLAQTTTLTLHIPTDQMTIE